ncbi:MAG: hypothetical protein ACRCXZ_00100 [Patescibacteria group bacterium]
MKFAYFGLGLLLVSTLVACNGKTNQPQVQQGPYPIESALTGGNVCGVKLTIFPETERKSAKGSLDIPAFTFVDFSRESFLSTHYNRSGVEVDIKNTNASCVKFDITKVEKLAKPIKDLKSIISLSQDTVTVGFDGASKKVWTVGNFAQNTILVFPENDVKLVKMVVPGGKVEFDLNFTSFKAIEMQPSMYESIRQK